MNIVTPWSPVSYRDASTPPNSRKANRVGAGWGLPPLDLARTFGPMSAVHAALDRAGAGMPCGFVARFTDRTCEEVEAGIGAAALQFPILRSRLVWSAGRPTLVADAAWTASDCAETDVSLAFVPEPNGLLWRYALRREGNHTWLKAVWTHAAADGRSMLHFLDVVSAEIDGRPAPMRAAERRRTRPATSLPVWLGRFLFERCLPYVKPNSGVSGVPGVSWCSLAPASTQRALASARDATTGFGAWLAGVACIAYCEQQKGRRVGRISLDLLASRGDTASLGGFGFAAGSLLIPVVLRPAQAVAAVAHRIYLRQQIMMADGWDGNLERFLGQNPRRHRLFASLEARGIGSPSISVSWKGTYPNLGAGAAITNIACFATSSVAHVSAHVDANGLSISVASRLGEGFREDLLTRIVTLLDGITTGRMRALDRPMLQTTEQPSASALRIRTA